MSITKNPSPGNRDQSPLPHGLLAADALRPASPGLPHGVWRDDCLEKVIEANQGRLPPSAERVLRFYVRQTRPADWTEPGRGPVAYTSQRSAIQKLNLDRKSVYNAERCLEKLGLIVKFSADNGRRYGPQGGDGEVCGIYFAPMIARYEDFLAQSAEVAAMFDRLSAARKLASSLRFRLRKLARAADDAPQGLAGLAMLDELPSNIMAETDMELLAELAAAFCDKIRDLEVALEAAEPVRSDESEVGDNTNNQRKIPHAGGPNSPRHINTTNNPSEVRRICDAENRTVANATDDNAQITAANAAEPRKNDVKSADDGKPNSGNAFHNPSDPDSFGKFSTQELVDMLLAGKQSARRQLEMPLTGHQADQPDGPDAPPAPPNKVIWTMRQLFTAASVEFRSLLDATRDPDGRITQSAFIAAAQSMCLYLGISRNAWGEACAVMGQQDAALALMVLDRNRTHPTNPVKNPGGVLRAMTERATTGELKLDASIFAIIGRAEDARLN